MKKHKSNLQVIDIGHSGLSLDSAQIKFETAVSDAIYEGETRVLKIITGHGSGELKKIVRRWCKDQEGRFKGVINGENYHMFDSMAVEMRSECQIRNDNDFGRKDSAITYIWLW